MERIPPLAPCPRCTLKVAKGKGPGGVAWHDCSEVLRLRTAATPAAALTVDQAVQRVLAVAVDKAPGGTLKDVVALLASVTAMRKPTGGDDGEGTDSAEGELLEFLRRDDPEATTDPVQRVG